MSKTTKYLSLLVMLTFMVGQVQFAYSSYFCTMTHTAYNLPAVTGTSNGVSCEGDCGMVAGISAGHHYQLVDASCMQLRLAEKKVVDSFAGPDKAQYHNIAVTAILPARLFSVEPVKVIVVTILASVSPPPDIPTLNSNLRI